MGRHPGTSKRLSRRRGGSHTHLLWLVWGRGRCEALWPADLLSRTLGAAVDGWRKGGHGAGKPRYPKDEITSGPCGIAIL